MLSAPAGTGKSVLARQLLAADTREELKVDAVAHLDDPFALARALVDAVGPTAPPTPNLLTSITASEQAFSATVLAATRPQHQAAWQPLPRQDRRQQIRSRVRVLGLSTWRWGA